MIGRTEVAKALSLFSPVWDTLVPREKERVLRLLLERVVYDGAEGASLSRWLRPFTGMTTAWRRKRSRIRTKSVGTVNSGSSRGSANGIGLPMSPASPAAESP
jgi:hypothetical protein